MFNKALKGRNAIPACNFNNIEQPPSLRFDMLDEIENLLPGYPIVLHGASPVCKINIDSDGRLVMTAMIR